MTKLLIGLLMIFFISGQSTAQFEITFELTQQIYEWVSKVYQTIQKYKNPDKSIENIEMIMNQVAEVSSKLDALETHLDIKLDEMLNLLLNDIKVEANIGNSKAQLRHYLNKIDYYFDLSREYKFGGAFGNQTLKDFAFKMLWSESSMPDLLNEMHDLFVPDGIEDSGLLFLMHKRSMLNLLHDCNNYISAQQQIYYTYIHLIIAEMKGLMTLQQSYLIERLFDESVHNYVSESNSSWTGLKERVKIYFDLFSQTMGLFPQHIRRCEVNPPKRGVNFLELQKFSRIAILDVNTVIDDLCLACPKESTLNDISLRTNTTINDCKDMGTEITACPAESGSPHEYLWWRDEAGNHYGPDTPCAKTKTINGGSVRVPSYRDMIDYFFCRVCACSVQTNNTQKEDSSTIWRISVTDQISDLFNNKVVTGIRFVTQDNALHLQIQQAQFTYSGMIYNDSEWKGLDIGFYDKGIDQVSRPMSYEPLRQDRRTLYLDDISAPEGFVVTGVRFQLAGDSAFKIQIYISEYELGTGNLFPFGGNWIDASRNSMSPEDYKRERIEINMDAPDDPTRSSEFTYNLASNKFIKFTHTDIYKDAGQTTIPLIDAQSVETSPSFPLSGIGLSFIERNGFGGYIIPRIYSLNVTYYMKYPIINTNIPLTTSEMPSTTQEVQYEFQSLGGNEYLPDSKYNYTIV